MVSPASRHAFSIFLVIAIALTAVLGQRRTANQKPSHRPQPQASATPPPETDEIEVLTTDTDLVMVPLIAADRGGMYVTDLRKEEFTITEDDVQQEIAFFGRVAAPFHVVLLLDTSLSTRDKLKQIQQAASTFVEQLQEVDRVKIISFDNKVNDLNEFTSNRSVLRSVISSTKTGDGTKVYDAVELAISVLRKIPGRRAIVLFSDGVDWYSDRATFDGTLRFLDEEGVVVYPIRFDTRATTEAIARQQAEGAPVLPTVDVIRKPPPSGTTPPTFPSDGSIPTSGSPRTTGPFGLPLPDEIMRRRREQERNRYPDPSRNPAPTGNPGEVPPDPRDRNKPIPRVPDSKPSGTPQPTTTSGPDDSIKAMLDLAYLKADSYLEKLAEKSGGRLLRADTIGSLPDAFAQVAAELRTQYMIGYYPLNKERDERYRKIKVKTKRKDISVRARPGYLATNAR